jgi:hypothetical protein
MGAQERTLIRVWKEPFSPYAPESCISIRTKRGNTPSTPPNTHTHTHTWFTHNCNLLPNWFSLINVILELLDCLLIHVFVVSQLREPYRAIDSRWNCRSLPLPWRCKFHLCAPFVLTTHTSHLLASLFSSTERQFFSPTYITHANVCFLRLRWSTK